MKKRFLASLAVAIFTAFTLTACANKTSQSATSADATTTVSQGEEETTTEATSGIPTYEKTPNINADMETMKTWDIIKEIKTGINIGNSLDCEKGAMVFSQPYVWETAWLNPKITESWVDACIEAGFNIIRIPVSWGEHVTPNNYQIVETWMKRVQEVVDYAYNKGVYVILNNHHGSWNYPYYDNQEAACNEMRIIWAQIAERFKDYDEHLIFEGENEPRKVGTPLEWNGGDREGREVVNAMNMAFVETIRNAGGSNPYRLLMIPGYAAAATKEALAAIEVPDDDRIIVSVHAYTPYNFALNTSGSASWDNQTGDIDYLMSTIKTLFIDKNIPVIIGEYGAVSKDNEEERAAWAKYYLTEAKKINVPCVWWDNGLTSGNGERLGLINRKTNEVSYPKILEAIQSVYAN